MVVATQEIFVVNGLDDPGLFSALTSDPEYVWDELGVALVSGREVFGRSSPRHWQRLRKNLMPTEVMVAATVAENRAKQGAHLAQQCTISPRTWRLMKR